MLSAGVEGGGAAFCLPERQSWDDVAWGQFTSPSPPPIFPTKRPSPESSLSNGGQISRYGPPRDPIGCLSKYNMPRLTFPVVVVNSLVMSGMWLCKTCEPCCTPIPVVSSVETHWLSACLALRRPGRSAVLTCLCVPKFKIRLH